MKRTNARRARGSVLVLALMVSAAAAIAGMWMVLSSDLRVRANRYLVRASDATRVAGSGLESARIKLGESATWTGFAQDLATMGQTGVATVTAAPLGVMRSTVTSVGALGDATQKVSAELRAVPHPAFDFNVVSTTTVKFEDAVIGGHIRANGNVTSEGDIDFSGTLETLTNASVTSAIQSWQVAKIADSVLPPTTTFAAHIALASPLVGVPLDPDLTNGALLIERIRLAPNSNPYGGVNAKGCYVFDAANKDLTIRDCYVQGTLILRNVHDLKIERGYFHQRADNSLATLLVQGDAVISLENALYEAALLMDLNADGDLLDVHPPRIAGVIYVTGKLTLPYGGTVAGCAMGNRVTIVGAGTFEDDPTLVSQPVLEFTQAGPWDVVAGSVGEGP